MASKIVLHNKLINHHDSITLKLFQWQAATETQRYANFSLLVLLPGLGSLDCLFQGDAEQLSLVYITDIRRQR